ncbi:DUF2190 family protein [Paracoccus tibetensis]|uniref:Predicted phage recombinase, RecA/RadA family n=1 Tax=Paracoccus tibetensis TaxID=336292 RepID=A0A1G5HD59_9RHOB|nr:DUF2190 family protein [Paracoccus tibetensis]SCY61621.1 Predicted phage recombinase, RecA/RadA family [Paracoccus tibetensis]
MKNYVQPGEHLTLTMAAAVVSGQLVRVGSIVGVAQGNAAEGEDVVLVRRGVFDLPKTAAQAWTAGAKVYLTTEGDLTTTASGNTLIGVAVEAAANPSAIGRVLLDGAIR